MIEAQLIIIFNNKIENLYLLTINNSLEYYQNSKAFLYYKNLKTNVKLNIINSHAFLTYNVKTLKMFLNTLLNIDYNYVIYSDEGNVEYTINGNDFFNPYKTEYEFIENNDVIYKNYPKSFNGSIFYITNYNVLLDIYPEYNVIKDNTLLDFVNKMFYMYIDFGINYTYEKESFYLINITNSEILTILKDFNYKNYKTTYIIKESEKYFIQGSSIKIFDFNKLLFNKSNSLLVVSENDVILFATDGYKVFCEEIELLEYILTLIKKYRIERISNKIIYNIKFNVIIDPQIQISSFFSNILSETNSKNIYSTHDKQATIIFTRKKIIIKMLNKIEQLALYISELILYYSMIENKNKNNNNLELQKKIGITYLSRICQNLENKIRKPITYSKNEVDLSSYEKIKDNFYKNATSEIFIDGDIIHKCDKQNNIERKYIGFIEKFYVINKLCIPCCYLYTKEEEEIFNNCTTNNYEDVSNIIDPYILTYNKVLTKNRLSFLYPSLDKIFNKNSKIKIENNRIVYAKDFYCIAYYNNEIIENKSQIYSLLKNNNVFIFLKNIIICPFIYRYINDINNKEPIVFYVLVQNILHVIVKINKDETKDKINIDTNVSNLYTYIKDYNKSITKSFSISNSGLVYNENGFYIDGVKFTDKLYTNYLTSIPYTDDNFIIEKNVDMENVEIEDKDFFIKTYNCNDLLKYKK